MAVVVHAAYSMAYDGGIGSEPFGRYDECQCQEVWTSVLPSPFMASSGYLAVDQLTAFFLAF
jgi:hypothetical protein